MRHVIHSPALWMTLGTGLVLWIFPSMTGGPLLSPAVAFAGASGLALGALGLTPAPRFSGRKWLLPVAGAAALLALCFAMQPTSRVTVALVNGALVLIAHRLGGTLGRKVQHPGHLLPAGCVAAAADIASVLTPQGLSHTLVQSERALSVTTIAFPLLGSPDVAPVLGVGDLVLAALFLGAADAHHLGRRRMTALLLVGTLGAGALAARTGAAVPALPFMVAAVLVGIPAARRVAPRDRPLAYGGVATAGAVVLGVLLKRWLS